MGYDVELIEGHYVDHPSVQATDEFYTWCGQYCEPLDSFKLRYLVWRRPVIADDIRLGFAWKYYVTFRNDKDALLYKLSFG